MNTLQLVLGIYVIVGIIVMILGITHDKGLILSLLMGLLWPIIAVIAFILMVLIDHDMRV